MAIEDIEYPEIDKAAGDTVTSTDLNEIKNKSNANDQELDLTTQNTNNKTDLSSEDIRPDSGGGYTTPINPNTSYGTNIESVFNPLKTPLKEFNIIAGGAGQCDVLFAILNGDLSFDILHMQSFTVIEGSNIIGVDEITSNFDYADNEVHILAKGPAGMMEYKTFAGGTLVTIADGASVYSESSGIEFSIVATVYAGDTVLNRTLDTYDKRLFALDGLGSTFDLATELETKTHVVIPDGTHVIDTTVVVPSGVTIVGNSNKSILMAGASCTQVLNLTEVDDIVLKNFKVVGTGAPNRGSINSLSDAVYLTQQGNNFGVVLAIVTNVIIDGLTITGFDALGLNVQVSSFQYTQGCRFINLNIYECYAGARFLNSAEYSVLSNSTITKCDEGVQISCGNFALSNNTITGNRANVVLRDGANSGHGTITGCLMNHGAFAGLIVFNMLTGYSISGCVMIDAPIEIHGSEGVNITGGIIGSSILVNGGLALQSNAFMNNTFQGVVYGGGTITLTDNTATLLKNNYWQDGSDASGINN